MFTQAVRYGTKNNIDLEMWVLEASSRLFPRAYVVPQSHTNRIIIGPNGLGGGPKGILCHGN